MTTSRRTFLQMATAASAASFAPGWAGIAHAADLPLVRMAGAAPTVRPDHAWQFLGIPMGYYEKLGFRGDYVPTTGSAAALQLLLAGEVEVANCGFLELIATKTRQPDLPMHMYYSQERQSSYEVIVPSDSTITSLKDLAGKSIGVPSLASGAVPFARGLLRSAGMNPEGVNFLPIGIGAQALAALDSGEVQAISIFVGSIAAMELLGREFRSFKAPVAGGGMVMLDKFVRENRDLAAAIYRGLILNQMIMGTYPEATARAYWAAYGAPSGNRDEALRSAVHFIRRTAAVFQKPDDPQPWGVYTDQEWATFREFFGGPGGFIPENAKLSDFYSPELAKDGNNVDLNLIKEAVAPFAE